MNKQELIGFKKIILDEYNKRNRIVDLRDSELVKEYMSYLINCDERYLVEAARTFQSMVDKIRRVDVEDIIKEFSRYNLIQESNGIYVCVNSFSFKPHGTIKESIESDTSDMKEYIDIESRRKEVLERRISDEEYFEDQILGRKSDEEIDEFEHNHIVLNPYNSIDNNNGYDEVRFDFLKKAYDTDNEEAVKYVLNKYKRIGNR